MRFDRQQFFDGFRPWYHENGGGELRDDHVKNLEFLLGKFESSDWFIEDVRRIAYAIATMHVETFVPKTGQRYEPVTEFGPKSYFNKYDPKFAPSKAKQLGNINPGDGYLYRGRGDVQITGRDNYVKFGIADTPDKALDPDLAFHIMEQGMRYGLFTGLSLNHYIAGDTCDYVNARRVINGQNRAKEIAGYAHHLEQILTASVADAPAADEGTTTVGNETTGADPHGSGTDGLTGQPPPANPGDVVVEKEQNVGFFAKIKLKVAGWLGAIGGTATLSSYKDDVTSLGLPAKLIEYAVVAVVAAFVLWFLYQAVMHIWQAISKRWLTTSLIAANATPTNTVVVACQEDLEKYAAIGYKVVQRQ